MNLVAPNPGERASVALAGQGLLVSKKQKKPPTHQCTTVKKLPTNKSIR